MERLKTIAVLAFVLLGLPAMAIAAVALFAVASISAEPPSEPSWDETLQSLPAPEPTAPEPTAPEPEPIPPEPEPEPEETGVVSEIATGECGRDAAALHSRLQRAVAGRARICGIAVGNKTGDFSLLLDKNVEIDFTIDPAGQVGDLQVGGLGRDRELLECLEMAFSELRPGADTGGSCRYRWHMPMRPDRPDSLVVPEGRSLTRADVLEGVRSNLRGLIRCLKRARNRGELEAGHYTLRLDWTIRRDGTVEAGRLVGPDAFLEGGLPTCVGGALQRWKFPQGLTAVPVRNLEVGPFMIE